MFKGVVMQIEDKHIVLMRHTGQIDRIPRGTRVCETGQEILYSSEPKSSIKGLLITVAGLTIVLAACFFFLLRMLGVSSSSEEVIAYVSMDINPSIEMGIDENEIVRDLRGLNNDGTKLAQSISYEDQTLEQVVASILDKEEQNSLKAREGDIIIAATTVGTGTKLSDVVLSTKLKKQVTDHLQMTHPANASSYIVASFAVPYEIKGAATAAGLSMGKYAIYLRMKSLNVALTTEQLASTPLTTLAKDIKSLKTELTSGLSITKMALLELLKEEQNGTLGAKKGTDIGLQTVTPRPIQSPSPTVKPSATPKPTPVPSGTQTPKPSATPADSGSAKPSGSPTGSPKPSGSPTVSPKPSGSPTGSTKPSPTATPKPTVSPTASPAH